MFKYITIILLTVTILLGSSTGDKYKKELVNFSYEQKELMLRIYMQTHTTGKAYTLIAIAWKESTMGKYVVNLYDGANYKHKGSFGCFHTLLNTVMKREGHDGVWTGSRTAERLIADYSYALDNAIIELNYWDMYWSKKGVPKKYSHMVASYNAGFKSLGNKNGAAYAKDILLRVHILQDYFKQYSINEILK